MTLNIILDRVGKRGRAGRVFMLDSLVDKAVLAQRVCSLVPEGSDRRRWMGT